MRVKALIGASVVAGAGALAYRRLRGGEPTSVERAVTVDKPADELYAFWRSFENAPRFMENVLSVETRDDGRSRWLAHPAGSRRALEWDAELTDDRPGELIAWRAVAGKPLVASGRVEFSAATGGRGTQVRLRVDVPAGGPLAREALERQVTEDLRRFKRLVETGEIPRVDGQPAGARSPLGKLVVGRRERMPG